MKKLTKTILLITTLFATQPLAAKSSTPVKLTSTNYLSLLIKSKKPVLVEFWAPWCKACKYTMPKYKKASKKFKGKVVFAELNVDSYADVAPRYGVRSIPTLILFKNNKIVKRLKGAQTQKEIETFVKNAL